MAAVGVKRKEARHAAWCFLIGLQAVVKNGGSHTTPRASGKPRALSAIK